MTHDECPLGSLDVIDDIEREYWHSLRQPVMLTIYEIIDGAAAIACCLDRIRDDKIVTEELRNEVIKSLTMLKKRLTDSI